MTSWQQLDATQVNHRQISKQITDTDFTLREAGVLVYGSVHQITMLQGNDGV